MTGVLWSSCGDKLLYSSIFLGVTLAHVKGFGEYLSTAADPCGLFDSAAARGSCPSNGPPFLSSMCSEPLHAVSTSPSVADVLMSGPKWNR